MHKKQNDIGLATVDELAKQKQQTRKRQDCKEKKQKEDNLSELATPTSKNNQSALLNHMWHFLRNRGSLE